MGYLVIATLASMVASACGMLTIVAAFRRSVGSGLMVVLIPFFAPYYAAMELEGPRRRWVAAGLVSGTVIAATFFALAAKAMALGAAQPTIVAP